MNIVVMIPPVAFTPQKVNLMVLCSLERVLQRRQSPRPPQRTGPHWSTLEVPLLPSLITSSNKKHSVKLAESTCLENFHFRPTSWCEFVITKSGTSWRTSCVNNTNSNCLKDLLFQFFQTWSLFIETTAFSFTVIFTRPQRISRKVKVSWDFQSAQHQLIVTKHHSLIHFHSTPMSHNLTWSKKETTADFFTSSHPIL